MNATIAELILTRLGALPWLEKTTGLTRPVTFGGKNGTKDSTLPVACTVTDPQACTLDKAYAILPDEKFRSVVFFEGATLPERIRKPGIGIQYRSRLRMVVWMNCAKLGGECNCGDLAYQSIVTALDKKMRYDSGVFKGIKHVVTGGATRGTEIFSKYTLDEKRSQYLHFPFDFFAVDIDTDFRLMPGCEADLVPEDAACWFIP